MCDHPFTHIFLPEHKHGATVYTSERASVDIVDNRKTHTNTLQKSAHKARRLALSQSVPHGATRAPLHLGALYLSWHYVCCTLRHARTPAGAAALKRVKAAALTGVRTGLKWISAFLERDKLKYAPTDTHTQI